jgi:hypothetical protein
MAIHFSCGCGKSFSVQDQYAGKKTKCPACSNALTVPVVTATRPIKQEVEVPTGPKPQAAGEEEEVLLQAAWVVPGKAEAISANAGPADATQPKKKKKKDIAAKADQLRSVGMGLWLVLAGMVIQVLAVFVALALLIARIKLSAILLTFQIATLLPVVLQATGHWLCLSVPRGVRFGKDVPVRHIVIITLILDVLGLLLLAWTWAADFKLLAMPVWAPDPGFVLLVPMAFLDFLIALAWYIDRRFLSWWGRAIQVLLIVLGILALGVIMMASVGAGRGPGAAAVTAVILTYVLGAISVTILYLAYIGLLFFLAPATRAYAAQLAGPEDASPAEAEAPTASREARSVEPVEGALAEVARPGAASATAVEVGPSPKKKKRPRTERPARDVPDWAWATGGCLLAVVVAAVVLLGVGLSGRFFLAAGLGTALVVAVPVGLVILIVSMFISSAVSGGIDFGDVRVAVPKAVGLLTVVSLIGFIPFIGWFIAIPVWFVGLMNLFFLDIWETRVLFIINWGVNTLFKLFVLAVIVNAVSNSLGSGKKEDEGEQAMTRPRAGAKDNAGDEDPGGKLGKPKEPRPRPATPAGPAPLVVVEKGRRPPAWPENTLTRALRKQPAPSIKSKQGTTLRYCRDGRALAVGGSDLALGIWDLSTMKQLDQVPPWKGTLSSAASSIRPGPGSSPRAARQDVLRPCCLRWPAAGGE